MVLTQLSGIKNLFFVKTGCINDTISKQFTKADTGKVKIGLPRDFLVYIH